MVNDSGVALYNAFDVEVASEPGIGNLIILEASNGSFNGLSGRGAGLEECHSDTGSPRRGQAGE
jgi:hypothetical protein